MADRSRESDSELIAAMARGDRAGLSELYDRYAPLLLATAQRMLGTAVAAEDLVHDVLLEAWRRADTYDPERGSARTWLLVRLRSRALDRLRRERRSAAWILEVGKLPVDEESGDPRRLSEHARVRKTLAALPPHQQEVLTLAYFGGLSMTEIAEALAIPIGTVKSRTAAALARLRLALNAPAGGDA